MTGNCKSSLSRLATAVKSIAEHALCPGFIDEIFGMTRIDGWLLDQIKEIVDFEEELVMVKN